MKLLLWLSLPLLILDQVTKYLIYVNFEPPTNYYVDEIPKQGEGYLGFLYIHRVHNTGIAFGTFNGGAYANVIFGFIAASALVLLFWFSKKDAFPTRIGKIAVALLVAGIIGNLSDRIFYGYVVDFISVDLHFSFTPFWSDHPFGPRFASFNIADACISFAAIFLIIAAFQVPPTEPDSPPDESVSPQT